MVYPLVLYVVIGRFPGVDVCTRLSGLGPIRALVGQVAKIMSPEALDLSEVLKIPMAIIVVRITVGRVIFIILCKYDGAWRRT